jgi:ATP-dependent DNA ligase
MMKYDHWQYIYPPRPKTSIPFDATGQYADAAWTAQLKLNGTRNLIFVSPDGEVDFWNRHKERHKAWSPPPQIVDAIKQQFACGKWIVVDSELLHSKHASVKNTLYLFGLLVCDNEYLVGCTYADCHAMLAQRCGKVKPIERFGGFVSEVSTNIWLANLIPNEQWDTAWQIANSQPIVEGIVLKRLAAKLEYARSEDNNGSWMIRCRKATKNYQF